MLDVQKSSGEAHQLKTLNGEKGRKEEWERREDGRKGRGGGEREREREREKEWRMERKDSVMETRKKDEGNKEKRILYLKFLGFLLPCKPLANLSTGTIHHCVTSF
jgi:hypothetical protein